MFKSLYQHVGLFIAQNVTSNILSKDGSIAINIQEIIFQLKSDTQVHAKIIQLLRIFRRSPSQKSANLQACSQQYRSFQTNHFQILLCLHIFPMFKLHIQLLPFTDFKCGQAKYIHHFFQMFNRALSHKLISQYKHCIPRKNGSIVIPDFMYCILATATVCTVHQVVMQKSIIMIHFNTHCRIKNTGNILLIQIVGHQHQYRTDSFSAHGQHIGNGSI